MSDGNPSTHARTHAREGHARSKMLGVREFQNARGCGGEPRVFVVVVSRSTTYFAMCRTRRRAFSTSYIASVMC